MSYAVDPTLAGVHLAISWLNASMYSLELTLATYYFTRFTARRPLFHFLVLMLVADAVCMFAVLAAAWMYLNGFPSTHSRWTVPVSIFMTTWLAVTEEVFLINRCRRLSQPRIIMWFLLLLVATHAGLSAYSAIYCIANPGVDLNYQRFGKNSIALSACVATAVDVLIPLSLTWQLYKVTPPGLSRKRTVGDSIINAISSGCLGGLVGILLIILFPVKPAVSFILSSIMGRVYSITLWTNLIVSNKQNLKYLNNSIARAKSVTPSLRAEFSLTTLASRYRSMNFSVRAMVVKDKDLPPTPGADTRLGIPNDRVSAGSQEPLRTPTPAMTIAPTPIPSTTTDTKDDSNLNNTLRRPPSGMMVNNSNSNLLGNNSPPASPTTPLTPMTPNSRRTSVYMGSLVSPPPEAITFTTHRRRSVVAPPSYDQVQVPTLTGHHDSMLVVGSPGTESQLSTMSPPLSPFTSGMMVNVMESMEDSGNGGRIGREMETLQPDSSLVDMPDSPILPAPPPPVVFV